MAKNKKIQQKREISIEEKGKTYKADYYVERGVVIGEVITKDGGILRLSTQVGGSTPQSLVRMWLREIIHEGKL